MENSSNPIIKRFIDGLSDIEIVLTDLQIEQFMVYYELLIEWNKVMNLTAITEFEEVVNKHFIDSLTIVKAIRLSNEKILDLGTGAGFPGIPIKIVFPDTEILLLDSLNKRIQFLNEVINKLSLNNIIAIHGRAEDLGHKTEYREKYDICTSRAVAKLSSLSEYCLPFVKKGGYFVSYKSGNVNDELIGAANALKLLKAKVEDIQEFKLPKTEIERTLIVIKKTEKTDKKYPRSAGKPTKEPL